jgi:hypothetical protein
VWEDSKLLEQVEVFESAPVLEYLPVCDAPDLVAHHGCLSRGRRDVRERAEVGAAGDDAGYDLVVLGEHVRDDHVDVREGPVQADDVAADTASPRDHWHTRADRAVVDEVVAEDRADDPDVSRSQRLIPAAHDSLRVGGRVCRGVGGRRRRGVWWPGREGECAPVHQYGGEVLDVPALGDKAVLDAPDVDGLKPHRPPGRGRRRGRGRPVCP